MLMRIFGYIFGVGAFMLLCLAVAVGVLLQSFNTGLPDYDKLAKYEPPVMTRIHAANGELVAEHARERRPNLPVIYMSGYPCAGEPVPESIYLTKPFGQHQLQRAVRKALELSAE